MIKALFTSATGMNAQTTYLDNTSNNIANVNTTGFKKGVVQFQDLIYEKKIAPGSDGAQGLQVPTGLQIGSGTRVSGVTKVFSTGSIVNTTNPYDIAIEGDGFFQVSLPDGEVWYTRDGSFNLNQNGNLVTADGFLLSPPLTIPLQAVSVSIGADGTVSVINAGSPQATTIIGQLTLARFINPAGLNAEGRNLFAETASSGPPVLATPGQNGLGLVQQGYVEQSNVNVVTELVNLIVAQRAYEFNTRAVRTADNMLASTTDLIR
jgi:flagellar basal-body rod protein FlgG